MRGERLRPRGSGAIFEAIAATDEDAEVAALLGRYCFAHHGIVTQRVGDHRPAFGPKPVVVQAENLEGGVF